MVLKVKVSNSACLYRQRCVPQYNYNVQNCLLAGILYFDWYELMVFRGVLGHFGHGHFGLGRFGLDISATDVSATENAKGGRFGQNYKFWVSDVCMHKCVMHFIIF